MKPFISILLSSLIFLTSLGDAMIILDFKINRNRIIERFCINKEDISCSAKCELRKRLSKSNEQEENIPIKLFEKQQLQFVYDKVEPIINNKALPQKALFSYTEMSSTGATYEVFHPPQRLS